VKGVGIIIRRFVCVVSSALLVAVLAYPAPALAQPAAQPQAAADAESNATELAKQT
jgi:hypothetical protein